MPDLFGGFLRAVRSSPPAFRKVLCRDCGLSYEEVNPTLEQANRVAAIGSPSFGSCPRCTSTRHQFVEHLHRDDGQDDVARLNHEQQPGSKAP